MTQDIKQIFNNNKIPVVSVMKYQIVTVYWCFLIKAMEKTKISKKLLSTRNRDVYINSCKTAVFVQVECKSI